MCGVPDRNVVDLRLEHEMNLAKRTSDRRISKPNALKALKRIAEELKTLKADGPWLFGTPTAMDCAIEDMSILIDDIGGMQ